MPDPDALTAELAVIRDRHALAASTSLGFSRIEDRHEAMIRLAYEDVPRLLKALGAALDRHSLDMVMDPATRILVAECARCCQSWPCREVRDITEAMTAGAIPPGRCICPPQILREAGHGAAARPSTERSRAKRTINLSRA